MSSLFSFGAIALTGALVLNNKGVFKSFLAKADPDQGSYTITAADFSVNGSGSLIAGGENWNYEGATISGNTVTISGVLYSNSFSGSDAASGRRGDGYTRMVINGLDKSSAVGLVLYEKSVTQAVKNTITDITSDIDLTVGGTIDGKDRRGLQFAQGAGGSFSFTSITLYYACTSVTPEIQINETTFTVGVGETGQLSTSIADVYPSDTVSYAWSSSDEDVATVDASGVVTGVAAGNSTITVTMTVNDHDYTDSLEITVNAAAATVVELATLDTSRIEGAGIFCRFDPSSASVTAAQLDTYTVSLDVEFDDSSVSNAVNHYTLQDKGDSSYTAYVVMDSAVGLDGAFTAQADFKDNTNNIIYRAIWHFDNGTLAQELNLNIASDTIVVGTPATLTASKGYYLDGTPTFAFESSDTSVLTLTVNDNVATLNGVAAGTSTVTVTMTLGGETYNKSIVITVTSGMTEIPLTITSANWGGSGCQFFNDMSFANTEGTWQLSDYTVNVTVTGASFSYSGTGACLQGSAIYLTFNAAPAASDEYTIHCELGRGSNVYTFTVSFAGTEMQ